MADRPIYFRDKKDELKGPFTEKQMQEWYRQGWFDSSFQIRIGDNGTFQSLGSLRELNGSACPFSENADNYVKLNILEQNVINLKNKFTHIRERMTVVEEHIVTKNSSSIVEEHDHERDLNISPKSSAENKINILNHRICHAINDFTNLSLFESIQISQIEGYNNDLLATEYEFHNPNLSFEENYDAASHDGLKCGGCNISIWNPKQFILHITETLHHRKAVFSRCSMSAALLKEFDEDIKIWKKEDQDRIDDSKRRFEMKFGSKSSCAELRPTHNFMVELHHDTNRLFPTKCSTSQSGRIYKSAEARQLLDGLHTHLQSGIPFCGRCQYLPIDINDYYRHMVTFNHWKRFKDSEQLDIYNHLTILICNNHSDKYFM